jgi:excisionase family DNA binding protein
MIMQGLEGDSLEKQSQFQRETVTLRVTEVARILGISRGSAYEAIQRGEIPHIRIGRRVLVPKKALDRFLNGEVKGIQD